jgi:hypothetical protein
MASQLSVIGEIRVAHRILVEIPEEKGNLGDKDTGK